MNDFVANDTDFEPETLTILDHSSESSSPSPESDIETLSSMTESSTCSSASRLSGCFLPDLPDDVSSSPCQQPVQPMNCKYPLRRIGNSNRACNPGWFKTYTRERMSKKNLK